MREGATKSYALGRLCRPRQWPTITKTDLIDSGYPVFGANGYIGYFGAFNHEEDTLVITCRGATCGEISWVEGPAYITGNAMCLDEIQTSIVSQRFLFHYLKWRGVADMISGSAQPQIIRADLEKVIIELPSYREQQEIAALLDTWDLAIERAGRLEARLHQQKLGLAHKLLNAESSIRAAEETVA